MREVKGKYREREGEGEGTKSVAKALHGRDRKAVGRA